jgi:RNA polymerase sigma-70 factor (ECF subfamily)
VRRAVCGDGAAIEELLGRHRDQLGRMVAVRIDPRLMARLDPSDVVQDVLAEAAKRLATQPCIEPAEFYPWLRQLAWDRLARIHRDHIGARKRSVTNEQRPWQGDVNDESVLQLAETIAASDSSPSRCAIREELLRRVRVGLSQLAPADREVLVIRFLEQLSTSDTAAVLGISESAVKSRQFRAIARLQEQMGDIDTEEQP